MDTLDIGTKTYDSLRDLVYGMHSIFCTNSPTTHFRADIGVDIAEVLTGEQNKFLWMERECGTCLADISSPAAVEHYFDIDIKQRYYEIDRESLTIRQVHAEEFSSLIESYKAEGETLC